MKMASFDGIGIRMNFFFRYKNEMERLRRARTQDPCEIFTPHRAALPVFLTLLIYKRLTFTTYAQNAYVVKVPFKDLEAKNLTSYTLIKIGF